MHQKNLGQGGSALLGLVLLFLFFCGNALAADLQLNGTTTTIDSVRSQVQGTNNSGTTSVGVANGSLFTAGSKILIITMQGAQAGQYEFNTISSINTNTLNLQTSLANTYNTNAQVIEVTEYDNVAITNSSILTCSEWNGSTGGVLVVKATNLTLDSSSFIDVTGKGFLTSTGLGAGLNVTGSSGGGGGAYGGDGSDGFTANYGGAGYGIIHMPLIMGSAGGRNTTYTRDGGKGGGIIFIQLSGTATINGTVKSDGQNPPVATTYTGGGGAGGSVLIMCSEITGSNNNSYITANGGGMTSDTYRGGGGGGGRIAIHCDSNKFNYPADADIQTYGGRGYNGVYGGAGTIYIKEGTDENLHIVSPDNNCDLTKLEQDGADIAINVMYVEWARIDYRNFEGCTIFDIRNSDLTLNLANPAVFDSIVFSVDLTGARTCILGSNVTAQTVTVAGLDTSNHAVLQLQTGVLINDKINLNGYTTLTNGIVMEDPVAVHLSNNDNDITNSSGAHIRFATLEMGTGSAFTNSGTAEVLGDTIVIGSGSVYQGAGSFSDSNNNMTVQAGGTFISQSVNPYYFDTVVIQTGATLTHSNNVSTQAYTLNFQCSGDFTIEEGVNIDLSGRGYNNTYGPGAGQLAYRRTSGSSGSTNYYHGGGGGAYGADGGNGTPVGTTYGSGGTRYGSIINPVHIGSGGGNGVRQYTASGTTSISTTYLNAGNGGGAFIANVGGTFTCNSSINVNGTNATQYNNNAGGGGGSGGSINITATDFVSSNPLVVFQANGGSRYSSTSGSYGGGGSGGRIALKATNSYLFSGNITAYGGDGYRKGGTGTIYIKKGTAENLYITSDALDANRPYSYIDETGVLMQGELLDINSSDVQISVPLSCNTVSILDSRTNATTSSGINIGSLSIQTTQSRYSQLDMTASSGTVVIGSAALQGISTSYQSILRLPNTITHVSEIALGGYTGFYNYGTVDLCVLSNIDNDIYNYNPGHITFESLTIASSSYFFTSGTFDVIDDNMVIESGGHYRSQLAGSVPLANVLIKTGASVTQGQSTTTNIYKTMFSCTGDFTLESGATINVNACGYPNASGPGAGTSINQNSRGGGGGAYGGRGSNGYSNNPGGVEYDTIVNPTEPGSGGGDNTYSTASRGGYGGGAVIIQAEGNITVNGIIYANGENAYAGGTTRSGGGGSGGCINLNAPNIAIGSSSQLQAIGGNRDGTYYGGGGGGGRIALICSALDYQGSINISGGTGYYMQGGAGTMYIKDATTEKILVQGSNVTQDLTVIDDNNEPDPLNLDLLEVSSANLLLLSVTQCDRLNVINSAVNVNPIVTMTIPTVDIAVNTSSVNRRTIFGGLLNAGDVSVQGYNTSYHAELELQNGSNILSSLITTGYTEIINNTTINLPSTYTMSGIDNDITNYGTVILPTFIVSSSSYVKNAGSILPVDTDLTIQSGGVYSFMKSGQDTFTDVTILSGGIMTHEQNTGAGYKVNLLCTGDLFVAGSVDVSQKGYIEVQGPGAGTNATTTNTGGSGGGHGGEGGKGVSNISGGMSYGSIMNPSTYGSGGGSNTSSPAQLGGDGGGIIHIEVQGTATINGTVKADGEKAPTTANYRSGGGGAAGSIKLTADVLDGSGSIQANGGAYFGVNCYGGGGGGGRIAVYTAASNSFSGSYLAQGGQGYYGYAAPGTIYINNNGIQNFLIKNSGMSDGAKTIVTADGDSPSEFFLMDISNAIVEVNKFTSAVTLNSLNSNLIISVANSCDIETLTYILNAAVSSRNLQLPASTTLSSLTLQGYNSSNRAIATLPNGVEITSDITLNGNVTLNNYTTINLPNTFYINGTSNIINNYGHITFATLNLASTSLFNYGTVIILDKILTIESGSTYYMTGQMPEPDYDLIIETGGTYVSRLADSVHFKNVTVYSGATMTHDPNTNTPQNKLAITCSGDFILASGAVIDVTGKGYTYDQGPGKGTMPTNASYGGGGAGYGGNGSMGYLNIAGGTAFGSINDPTYLGSGGGSTVNGSYGTGSAGGGAVDLNIAGTLTLNGTIRANGANVTSYNGSRCGGGGSGGSVKLVAATITGTETGARIEAKGGNKYSGSYYGGGGGGGRVALIADNICSYAGQFDLSGGDGYYQYGGAGTVYIHDSVSTHIKVIAGAATGERDITPLTDMSVPTEVETYEIKWANVQLTRLSACSEIDIVNSDVTINTASDCTIDALFMKVVAGAFNNRLLTCEPNTIINNATIVGYSTARQARITFKNGARILDRLETNGYTTVYNYTSINLPADYIRSGLDNDIYNYQTGSIVLPTLTLTANSYVQNFNDILPVDNNLTIDQNGTYDIAKNTQLTFVDVIVNGVLTHTQGTGQGYVANITCSNLTVGTTGSIDVSNRGYVRSEGPGAGQNVHSTSAYFSGSGAGHGAQGSEGYNGLAGGAPYGSIVNPVLYGSGGGTNTARSTDGYGGSGGGVVLLNVANTLLVNGYIKANGQTSPAFYGGGGAGGSINITTGSFNGSGTIEANGGDRNTASSSYRGGSGAGGRIAIYCATKGYTGNVSTYAGLGYNVLAGAGTIYENIDGYTAMYIKNNAANNRNDTVINNDYQSPVTLDEFFAEHSTVNIQNMSSCTQMTINSATITFTSTPDLGTVTMQGTNSTYRAGLTLPEYSTVTLLILNNYCILNNSGLIELAHFNGNYVNLTNTATGEITFPVLDLNNYSEFRSYGTYTIQDSDMIVGPYSTYICTSNDQVVFDDLTIEGYGKITHLANTGQALARVNIRCTGNLTVLPNGSFDATGMGYSAGNGPGKGSNATSASYGGGGAGYGAYGNEGNLNVPGGIVYGSISDPLDLGSGGGSNTYSNYLGGSGGGAVVLVVDGTLTLNGFINVNGNQPVNNVTANGGGGSGGSVNITADIVAGTNSSAYIRANGANNYSTSNNGGGGAGGRIAVKCNAYTYIGSINTYGGSGRIAGADYRAGAGTIYKEINGEVAVEIINDSNYYITQTPITGIQLIDTLTVTSGDVTVNSPTAIGTATLLNSKVDFQPDTTLIVSSLSIMQNSTQYDNYVVKLKPNTTVANITMQGINTSYRTYLLVETGAVVTGTIAMNGYAYLHNYGDIGLLERTNTYNSFSNWSTGSVTLANLNLNSYDYILYGGTVNIVDTSTMNLLTGSTLEMNTLNRVQVGSARIYNSATLTHASNTSVKESIVNIHCTGNFTIDSGGQVDVSYKGYSSGNGHGAGENANSTVSNSYKGGGGGAYGGKGGDSQYASSYGGYGGNVYGDAANPMDFGSGGGTGYINTNPYYGGAGGGLVLLTIDGTLTVNGNIRANGQNPPSGANYASGGSGAGGGINISANAIVGSSSSYIEANGGSYNTSSYRNGGGGGGRIHIGYQTFTYSGTIRANKGTSYSPNNAQNGTVDVAADPAGVIVISAVPSSLHANSDEVSSITAGPVKDSIGQPVDDGTEVTISSTGAEIVDAIDVNPLLDGIQLYTVGGNVTFGLQAVQGTDPGTVVVEVRSVVGTAYGSKNIPIIVGNPVGIITLYATPEQLIANGTSTTTITSGVITDEFGNPVPAGVYITIYSSAGTITTPDATGTIAGRQVVTQADGTISFVLRSSSTTGTANITADSHQGSAHGEISVDMVAGDPDKLIVLIPGETFSKGSSTGKTGTPTMLPAGTNRTVTVMIVDAWNNRVISSTGLVELVSSQEFSTVSPSQQVFDGLTGTMTFSVTEVIAATGLTLGVNYLDDAGLSTVSAQYTIQAAPPATMQIILPGESVYPGSPAGKSGSPHYQRFGQPFWITVNIVDEYFNKVPGRSDLVTLTSNATSATLPQPNLSNGSAYCSVTISDLGFGKILTASVAAGTVSDGNSSSFGVFNSLPSILSVYPAQSQPGINKIITISGDEFADGAVVEISGGGIEVTNVHFVDQTQLIVTIYVQPTASIGLRDIRVINPDMADCMATDVFEVRDDEPPVISNLSIPAGATVGDIVTISFDVNELLGSAPVVTIAGYNATYQSGTGGLHYTYTYSVNGSENTGYVPVYVTVQDFVGHVGYAAGHLIFDFYPPVIVLKNIDPSVISPNGDFLDDMAYISFTWSDESNDFVVLVEIFSGLTPVKVLWDGPVNGKFFSRSWDGTNDIGNPVPNGNYLIKVTIYDPADNSVSQQIGTVSVDYTANQQPYIIFTKEVQFATVGNDFYVLPISLTNNDMFAAHSLTLLDVINTDSSVYVSFLDDPFQVTIGPQQVDTVDLYVDSNNPDSDRVDVQLRLVNELNDQVDYSNLRIYMNPVPKPDLVVNTQDISFDPKNPSAGSNVTISVTVRNVGNEIATNIPVRFTSFGSLIGSGVVTISSLEAGAEVTVDTTVSFATAGMKLISIDVDPDDIIDELDDFNNSTNKMLFVGNIPLLSGGIRVLAQMNSTIPAGSRVSISGTATYSLLVNGVPNYDYVVKGGSVFIDVKNLNGDVILHQGGWFTNVDGKFNLSFTMPAIFGHGDYVLVRISVTDYTFIGRIQLSAMVYEELPVTPNVTLSSPDIDGDGIANFEDPDIDGDGILNEYDDDMDGDGIPNDLDMVMLGPITGDPDIDGDGIPNYYDDDIDGDGIPNSTDPTPYGNSAFYGGGWGGGFSSGGSGFYSGSGYNGGRGQYFTSSVGGGFAGIYIPSGGKIFTGTGESVSGYQGDPLPLDSSMFDAYTHSQDIAFSNNNPQLGEEITISCIIWADGYGFRENIPVSFYEIYPALGVQKIGSTQYIQSLYAGYNALAMIGWQNFHEGVYIMEVAMDEGFTDANNKNNAATRALIVGQLNQLLDVVINLPIEDMTYLALKDNIQVNFEVWSGVDMLSPDDLDTLVLTCSDSLALVSDIVVVKNGELESGSFNPANNVFTVQMRAPLPVGDPVGDLYPGTMQVIAQRIDNDTVLNGSDDVDVNLTAGSEPPESINLFATSYAVQVTWPQAGQVNRYRVYRDDVPLADVEGTQIGGVYSYIDYYVIRGETYSYFVTSYDANGKEGIVTSPVSTVTIPTRDRR
ncbi:MAG: CARDB domain-containing protein [Candidatus Auribacterota bacterium]|jgi:hypothetical protein|nr:CARDB domain-containing protein [Candidatus Auribacterota bacterium]